MTITMVLPYVVSANRYWRSFVPKGHRRAIVTLSEEAKAYKAEVVRRATAAGARPIAGRVALTLHLYPGRPQNAAKRMLADPLGWDDSVRSIDLDNALKVTLDALKGVAFVDDKRVRKIVAELMEPDGVARAVVTVSAIGAPQKSAGGPPVTFTDRLNDLLPRCEATNAARQRCKLGGR